MVKILIAKSGTSANGTNWCIVVKTLSIGIQVPIGAGIFVTSTLLPVGEVEISQEEYEMLKTTKPRN